MTVGAQEREVDQSVVIADAVAVMKRQRNQPSKPLGQSAGLTAILQQPGVQETLFDVKAIAPRVGTEQTIDGHRLRPATHCAAIDRSHERRPRKPEMMLAVRDAVPIVVVTLHLTQSYLRLNFSCGSMPRPLAW